MKDNVFAESDVTTKEIKIKASGVQVYYGETHAIKDVTVEIEDKTVTAFIGPSGCGKSTFLRCLNRMNDTIDICRVEGDIRIDDKDIYDRRIDPVQLRAKVGMVFQKPKRSPNRSMTMSPTGRGYTDWPGPNRIWMTSWNAP